MGKSTSEIEAGIRAALNVCSLEARGLWCTMRYLIDESDRPGHLRQNGRPMSEAQLARVAGCASDAVSPLLQELEECGLLSKVERTWHSPNLARLVEVRANGAARVQEWRKRQQQEDGGGRKPRRRERREASAPGVLRNTACNADVTSGGSPPASSSPPTTPSLSPPSTPDSVAAQRPRVRSRAKAEVAGGAAHGGEGDVGGSVMRAYTNWWIAEYPRTHLGVRYAFKRVDGVKAVELLKDPNIDWDLERAKGVSLFFWTRTEHRFAKHYLKNLVEHLPELLVLMKKGASGHVIGHRGASGAGGGGGGDDYAIPDSRRRGSAGADQNAA